MGTDEFVAYSIASREFFESLDHYQLISNDFHNLVHEILPPDWQVRRTKAWFFCSPPVLLSRTQGWKIHLSATLADAPHVLAASVSVLVTQRVPFKFVVDPCILSRLNSKDWPRSGSGKFVTVYPKDDEQFLVLLDKLTLATTGFKGPCILSDRRYNDSSTVYYRYGSFAARYRLRVDGYRMPMLTAPDGSEIPEGRHPFGCHTSARAPRVWA